MEADCLKLRLGSSQEEECDTLNKRPIGQLSGLVESTTKTPRKRNRNRVSLSPAPAKGIDLSPKLASDTSSKENTNDTNGGGDDDSSDDEVEFLLTIQPMSPKKPILTSQQTLTSTNGRNDESQKQKLVETQHPEDPSSEDNKASASIPQQQDLNKEHTETSVEGFSAGITDSPQRQDSSADVTDAPAAATSSGIGAAPFTERSSAYLQSLAEICHAILWDRRWRVQPQNRRLFAWEHGEDMSAVTILSRCYEPLPPAIVKPCSCLCCNTKKVEQGNPMAYSSNNDESEPSLPGISDETSTDRSLNLYCRLFSRKGPWFRMDDLMKYYTPKRFSSAEKQEEESTNSAATSNVKLSNPPNSPSKFFLPRSRQQASTTKSHKQPGSSTFDNRIDWALVERQVQSLSLLVDDLQQLFRMGLIRSFRDEEECGKSVGAVQKYGLLRMEEQQAILSKLGGSNSKRKSIGQGRISPRGSSSSTPIHENRIWKQMSQQQSISCLRKGDESGKLRLLPVTHHVDAVLINSLSSSIVLKASRQDYLPSAVFRTVMAKVKGLLEQTLAEHKSFLAMLGGGTSVTCFRLREAPVKTLRRVCRLYLCATNGPGDMRGDGSNGWRSVVERQNIREHPVSTRTVLPPGAHTWHHVSYPGRDYRFKLTSCQFIRAHIPCYVAEHPVEHVESSPLATEHIFSSIESLHIWEHCVELRANVDYLLELNELSLYNERRQARENDNDEDSPSGDEDGARRTSNSQSSGVSVDFLSLLSPKGRKSTAEAFQEGLAKPSCFNHLEMERDVERLLGNGCTNESGLKVCSTSCNFKNECEQVLGVIAVIAVHILESRNQMAMCADLSKRASMPWLRHLFWEGCLAYLLWDIIPVLERRGYYDFAVKALECLLFGGQKDSGTDWTDHQLGNDDTTFSRYYLSRRARGKAYERLVVDKTHILRRDAKTKAMKTAAKGNANKGKLATRAKKIPKLPTPLELSAQFCHELIKKFAPSGQITFSAIRTLAKRLKKPLSDTLLDVNCFEVQELGHRLANPGKTTEPTQINKYSDWRPITDQAVANSMECDDSTVGKRCSYIGFEADENPLTLSSRNVEELSMEYYRSGKLFGEDQQPRGGWEGWHDEGGKVRALFRVICSAPLLGMDWGCSYSDLDAISRKEHNSIHLTPYQRAPFDLHVGAEMEVGSGVGSRGFYMRRRQKIDQFLRCLEVLTAQELSDLVFDAVRSRLEYAASTHRDDPTLENDILQIRTLSLLAAGFGAKQLSSIFRCFLYDYRHYSGGLPDLLLVRAIYSPREEEAHESLVDLGEWVGESFSPEFKESRNAEKLTSFLEDRDAEFLGCSKVGDSGGQGRRSTRTIKRLHQPQQQPQYPPNAEESHTKKALELPSKLELCHKDRGIRVECMLVEVKSHNDRLDPRQEDWLNILDRHGNARVCKFVKSKSAKIQPSGKEKGSNKEGSGP